MELHPDLGQRVVLDTNVLAWLPSPIAGVERRMLDRRGDEIARATSFVRYAPGSRFGRHSHDGGEEILTLEGTFSDEDGDYPVGTYLRNPAGSNHALFSDLGCTILVTLRQMHQADQQRVAINTTNSAWLPGLVSGLEVLPLHAFGSEHVALVRWAPGTVFQAHSHPSGEEIFVVDGVFKTSRAPIRQAAGCAIRLAAFTGLWVSGVKRTLVHEPSVAINHQQADKAASKSRQCVVDRSPGDDALAVIAAAMDLLLLAGRSCWTAVP
jgi:anti-sigma factor ChrR (cupin superfamily)